MRDFLKLVTLLHQLKPNWRGGAEEVSRIQEKQLRVLLDHAKRNSPYHARRLEKLDVARCDLADVPTMTKADMMANFDDVVTDRRLKKADIERFIADPGNLGKLYLGQYGISHTSGSQGQPALIVQDQDALLTNFVVQFARGTIVKSRFFPHFKRLFVPARMAVITQKPGFYPSGAAFAYLPPAAKPFFNVLRLSVFDPIAENVAKLNAFKPEFITGYTSSLEVIAREEEAGRLRLRKSGVLKQITNVSEPLPDDSARRFETVFGVHVTNQYAMGECMALTSGCPVHSGNHLNADLAVLEIVDKNYKPVPPGGTGAKVLMTNLYNPVQPFIRYEVDDLVTASPSQCGCGSCLPKLNSIEGRAKDKFWIVERGVPRELAYYVFLAALHHYLDIAEHQVVQTGVNKFVLRAVAQPGRTLSVARLRELVHQSVAIEGLEKVLDIDVEVVPQIERGPSGKVTRAVNLFGPMPEGEQATKMRA